MEHSHTESWTDDVPVCKETGIGFSTNQVYREDGHPQEAHSYEDRTSNYKFDCCKYYAVFDGHEGEKAAEYCSQRMSVEICFSNLDTLKTDEEIKDCLKQAFMTVEQASLETMGLNLAERTHIKCDIPEGITPYEMYKRNPEQMKRIEKLDKELACGTTCAVAIICNDKLYVANVGNCRVLLCQTDQNSVLKVVQLSVDHDLKNEDELLRLAQIGIDSNKLRNSTVFGNQESTRCLGNHLLKVAYKEYPHLNTATQEPVSAEPDIHGGIVLNESCRFLLLMSSGLYKSIEEATGTDQVNKFIAKCVVEQFREQSTLTGVAQAVVDRAVRMHRDWCMSNTINKSCPPRREDMTLILRNFNYPLPNAITSPLVSFNPFVQTEILTNNTDEKNTLTESGKSVNSTNSSSGRSRDVDDEIGPDQKIEPYVDFSDFYNNFKIAKESGQLPDGIEWE